MEILVFCEEKLIEIYDGKFHASIINDEIMLITSEDVFAKCHGRQKGIFNV